MSEVLVLDILLVVLLLGYAIYGFTHGLLGSLEEIGRGRLSDITRAGSRVATLQAKHPFLFWMVAVARLVACTLLILGGLWTLRQAVKRR